MRATPFPIYIVDGSVFDRGCQITSKRFWAEVDRFAPVVRILRYVLPCAFCFYASDEAYNLGRPLQVMNSHYF